MNRVAVCLPARDMVCAPTTFDLIAMMTSCPVEMKFSMALGSMLPMQRTTLVKGAIEGGYTHVLFVDHDMRFPSDSIMRLLERDLPVVGANYRFRDGKRWTASDDKKNSISSVKCTGIEHVHGIGLGVSLIRTDVFRQIQAPWFAMLFEGDEFIGEDAYFSARCHQANIPVAVDHDLSQEIRHIGAIELGMPR